MDSYLRHKKLPPRFDLVIPFLKFESELNSEFALLRKNILTQDIHFFMVEPLTAKPVWAQDWLPDCKVYDFTSKADAVKLLKAQKNLGVFIPSPFHQSLAESIQADLRSLKLKRLKYEVPSQFNFKYFAWTILKDRQIAICEQPLSRYPLGRHEFNEDKDTPPNRAYLKMWEALCLGYIQVKPNQTVIDLGSSPGGWSWVLSQQATKVYSVDRAALDPKIARIPNIQHVIGDAFQVAPSDYKDCDWVFSDIICTPDRLLALVKNWQNLSNVKNFMCTIKFKGPCDFDIMREFLKIESSRIIHLYHNKNEVTWIKQE